MAEQGVLERIQIREVTGVFASGNAVNPAVDDLLLAGFDRADIDIVGKPGAMRREFVAPEDITALFAICLGVAGCLGAMISAFIVIGSGGTIVWSVICVLVGGAVGCATGMLIAHLLARHWAPAQATSADNDDVMLCVRVRTDEREWKAQQILAGSGATAVRVRQTSIEKRLEDLPLSSLRPDPWLGEERLGQP